MSKRQLSIIFTPGKRIKSFRKRSLRETTGGESICKDGGEKETDFIDCVAWRSTAEFVSKYFTKGRMMAVEGRLQLRDWVDKEKNKRRSAEIQVSSAYFSGSRTIRPMMMMWFNILRILLQNGYCNAAS